MKRSIALLLVLSGCSAPRFTGEEGLGGAGGAAGSSGAAGTSGSGAGGVGGYAGAPDAGGAGGFAGGFAGSDGGLPQCVMGKGLCGSKDSQGVCGPHACDKSTCIYCDHCQGDPNPTWLIDEVQLPPEGTKTFWCGDQL